MKRIRRNICTLVMLAVGMVFLSAQNEKIDHQVFLLGNTADISEGSKFIEAFVKILPSTAPFTVLINGDLIDNGESEGYTVQDSLKIDALLRPLSAMDNGSVIIVPGDRDWANSGKNGFASVKKLERLVKGMNFKNVKWAIGKGCPGPDLIEINDHLILVSINTQWWNHPYETPTAATAECKISTERDFLIALENLIEDTEDKNIIVSGHFPLDSRGEYGGFYPLGKHFSPPLFGSFKVSYRQNIGTSKDISNARFDWIRNSIENVINRKGFTVYTSGHEHNLQVLKMKDNFVINSGSPTEARYVASGTKDAIFTKAIPGVIELSYYDSGRVDYKINELVNGNNFNLHEQKTLFSSPCGDAVEGVHFNSAYNPCKHVNTVEQVSNSAGWKKDTVAVAGDYEVGSFTRFLVGNHYRSSWKAPVKVPYLDLDNTFGGLTVYEKGGGHQTTSLKIKGGDGREYVFRSIDKDPVQLLSDELQGTIVSRVLQDITSMQQPYGAMAIGTMLDATDILHVNPKLYMMPPSDKLGTFKEKYSSLLGMLEEKPINTKKVEVPFAEADEIYQSRKMFRDLYRDHDNQIDAKGYAKARMFDILVGDWGKHEDNWKWAGYKKEHGMFFKPIPRDRDYVFSLWDGFLTYLADRKWGITRGENFGYEINDIRSLTFSSQPADRRLLNELTRLDWHVAAEYIQTHITDSVIDAGVRSMPSEVYELSGKEIAKKLKVRIKDLHEYADRYYDQLMIGGVDIVGSNKREYFEAVRNADGTVTVTMSNIQKGTDKKGERQYYKRTFLPKETEEIRLYGLNGKDVFIIDGEAKKSIKVRVIGGAAPDVIEDNSKVTKGGKKTLIYEKEEESVFKLGDEAKKVDHWNKALYEYDRHRFDFNRYFPIAAIAYNSDQGLGATAGVHFTQKKYAKEEYSSKHLITGNFTTESVNILKYKGQYHHVFGKWDIELGALYADHNRIRNFYGVGNGTVKDDDLADEDFYQTTYNTWGANVGVKREFWKKSHISFNVNYENNETEREDGTLLGLDNPNPLPGIFGLDDTNLFELVSEFDIDFRDRAHLPERGIRLFVKNQTGMVTTNKNKGYGIISGFLEQYGTFKGIIPATFGLKVGGSTSYNDDTIPFYKQQFLGQNNNLRGFDMNRFTGESTVYINTELRIPLGNFRTSIVPFKYGIKGFYDGGRVYSDFDTTNKWHSGYGFGFYLVPLVENFTINVSTSFSDEESWAILFGIGSTFR